MRIFGLKTALGIAKARLSIIHQQRPAMTIVDLCTFDDDVAFFYLAASEIMPESKSEQKEGPLPIQSSIMKALLRQGLRDVPPRYTFCMEKRHYVRRGVHGRPRGVQRRGRPDLPLFERFLRLSSAIRVAYTASYVDFDIFMLGRYWEVCSQHEDVQTFSSNCHGDGSADLHAPRCPSRVALTIVKPIRYSIRLSLRV
eukprot:6182885-Pleurochrysis_carterae.AAC.4